MKIIHNKGSNIVTFFPRGKFISKIRTLLKLIHYTIKSDNIIDYEIRKTKSKKRYITYLPTLIKSNYKTEVIIYFKFKKTKKLRVDNNDDNPANFYYYNWFFNLQSYGNRKKVTPENLIYTAVELCIERYSQMIMKFGEEYDMGSLHSLIFKFI